MPNSTTEEAEKHFPVPPWAKVHEVTTHDHEGSSKEDLQAEQARKIGQHVVGAKLGKVGRRAGTYDTRDEEDDRAVIREYQEETDQEGHEREEIVAHPNLVKGLPAEIWKDEKTKPPNHVWNIREIKEKFDVNWKLLDPQHHLYARHVVCATETGIKTQPMPKKDDVQDKSAGDPIKKDEKAQDQKKDDKKQKDKEDKPKDSRKDQESTDKKEMSSEEEHFLAELISETKHLLSLQNNPGNKDPPRDLKRDLQPLIDEQDQFTPDNWIPRSSHLTRLTGSHPLNAEPDLTELYDAGLITPTHLHYVRSHGAVPKLDWDTHKLTVEDPEGLCENAREFSMDEIAKMDWICIPVTLACDGNRRGEVNRIKRGAGFDWGASGTSCVYWKGVLVRDILRKCGVRDQKPGETWYLHYEGADQLSDGVYSTSIAFQYAMDPTNDVMLAYEMNGHPLSPDHGYPIRSIIPGYVGGRCVKWLSKIWVSEKPSTNHYHIWDNRVVPSFVADKQSLIAKALFHNPDTACNEQALQSVIVRPYHGQIIDVTNQDQYTKPFRVEGFAYSGAGIKVQKVEISLDEGKSWLYCFRRYPQDAVRHGRKYFTWCFWHREVRMKDLIAAEKVRVRAWDATKNTQPEEITWNLMGMMNNCIYKVKSEMIVQDNKMPAKRFLHPCVPFAKLEGWMKAPKSEEKDTSNSGEKEFTLEELSKHDKSSDAWIVLNNKVYDVTSVLNWHPGGKNAIMNFVGKASADATTEYNGIHDTYAQGKRDECYLGVLSKKGIEVMKKDAERAEKERAKEEKAREKFAVRKHYWTPVKLEKVDQESEDTKLYTFRLPGENAKLGLPIGKHIELGLHFADAMAVRSYTPIKPILPDEEDGTFQVLVKTYFPNTSPFPPGGTVSNWLDILQIGDEMDVKGPSGDIEYKGHGKLEIEGEPFEFETLNLVGGGSGITPLYQLIHAILKTPDDNTKIYLLMSNKTPADTLMLNTFEKLASEHKDQFHPWFTVSKADNKWEYSEGRLDEAMMKKYLHDASDKKTGSFLCGPPGLIEKGVKPVLTKWGAKDGENLFGF